MIDPRPKCRKARRYSADILNLKAHIVHMSEEMSMYKGLLEDAKKENIYLCSMIEDMHLMVISFFQTISREVTFFVYAV
jgi:hypothetical protein